MNRNTFSILGLAVLAATAASAATPATAAKPSPAPAAASAPAPEAADPSLMTFVRQPLTRPTDSKLPLPFSIEVPRGWVPVTMTRMLVLGPSGSQPALRAERANPHMVVVMESLLAMPDVEEIAKNIRANAAKAEDWKAPRVEVREVGGVKGVLVQREYGTGDASRVSLTLKIPFDKGSLDFKTEAMPEDFPKLQDLFERILLSVQPEGPAKSD